MILVIKWQNHNISFLDIILSIQCIDSYNMSYCKQEIDLKFFKKNDDFAIEY